MRLVFDLEARLLADVSRGREELRRLFRDGRIDLVPQPGGFYVARSEILPLVVLMLPPPGGSPEERYTASSCGAGPQLDFPDPHIADGEECWIPFDKTIAVGWE